MLGTQATLGITADAPELFVNDIISEEYVVKRPGGYVVQSIVVRARG